MDVMDGMDGMAEWQSRPLDSVYTVVFIDTTRVKVRQGQVDIRPAYVALGVKAKVPFTPGGCERHFCWSPYWCALPVADLTHGA